MRTAIIVAAFGLVLGIPGLAPTALMSAATAQVNSANLEAQILAVANDPAAVQRIIDAEATAGNTDSLAFALSKAAIQLAATDIDAAATLVSQAVAVAATAGSQTQAAVGGVASAIATTAAEAGDTSATGTVAAAVASAGGQAAAAYTDAGGSAGDGVGTSTAVVTVNSIPTPAVGTPIPTQTPASERTNVTVISFTPSRNPAQVLLLPAPVVPVPPPSQVVTNAQLGNSVVPQIGGGSESSPT